MIQSERICKRKKKRLKDKLPIQYENKEKKKKRTIENINLNN
jgi:hypothetical protein